MKPLLVHFKSCYFLIWWYDDPNLLLIFWLHQTILFRKSVHYNIISVIFPIKEGYLPLWCCIQVAEGQKSDNGPFVNAVAWHLIRVIWLQSGEDLF